MRFSPVLLAGIVLAACAAAAAAQQAPVKAAGGSVPLFDNLGTHSQTITTTAPLAQRYFDQGLRLTFGFNHGEAIRAFEEAARVDPSCAMCYWGAALAYGPHVNAGMDSASGVKAYTAVQRALAVSARASERERDYIRALARRYAAVPPAERAHLDSVYAAAMGEVARKYPNDLDAATLAAEALMDLRPWNYWQPNGNPYPGTRELVSMLERVLALNPNHPGACHYYIHAVEAVQPELAVPCAERLASLMPGAGHMVHMPAHIYIRVGRYNDAIESNVHAVHADESYIASEKPSGIYPIGYYPHNYHFLAFASTMAGRSAAAIVAARATVATTPVELARQAPPVQEFVCYLHLTLVTFGRWDDVLREPVPPADLRLAHGMAQYARGIAHAAKGDAPAAQAALAAVREAAAASEGAFQSVLEIASHALTAEIAARRGELEEAITHFRVAMQLEDALQYIEPPSWYYPIRHSLGAALLRAGRAAEAETLYREDLKRFPENGWSLFGLEASLRAQGRGTEADAVQARFRRAWAQADVALAASRF